MIPPYVIPDVYVLDLEQLGGRVVVLRDSDHLLRRFGQVEFVEFEEGQETPFTLRVVADEIWSVIRGEVRLTLIDRRDGSPSEDKYVQLQLSGNKSQSILIPFGVAYSFRVVKKVKMIRLTTHIDGTHPGDETFHVSEFGSILSAK